TPVQTAFRANEVPPPFILPSAFPVLCAAELGNQERWDDDVQSPWLAGEGRGLCSQAARDCARRAHAVGWWVDREAASSSTRLQPQGLRPTYHRVDRHWAEVAAVE